MHEYGFNIDTCAQAPALALPGMVKRIGVAADHGGLELKQELVRMLRQAGYEVGDYGPARAG